MNGMKVAAIAVVAMMVALGGGLTVLDTDVDAVSTTYVDVGERVSFLARGPMSINDGSFPLRYDPNVFPYSGGTKCGLLVSGAVVNNELGCVEVRVQGTALWPGTVDVGVVMINTPQQHTFVTFERIVIQATADYPCAYFENAGWLSCPKGGTVTAPMYENQVVSWTCDGVTYRSGDEIPLVAAQSEFTMSGYTPLLKFMSSPTSVGRFTWTA